MREIIRIKSVDQVHQSLGIGAPRHPLVTLIPLERIASYDYGDSAYVMELYQISLKCGIDGSITYGRNSYDFHDGTLVFSRPEQSLVYNSEGTGRESSGWTLMFHPELIRRSELGRTIDRYSFFSYEANEALHLSQAERESLTDIVHKIEQEYSQNIDKHSQRLIVANIHLLLDYCSRYYDRQFYTRTNLNRDALSRFKEFLREYYDSGRALEEGVPSVKFCSEALNMSSYYLSDLLKKETGKNARHHIQDFIIDRAKYKLLNTNDQITRIAGELGFDYSQHFSKLFKAKTGMSPAAYRKAG